MAGLEQKKHSRALLSFDAQIPIPYSTLFSIFLCIFPLPSVHLIQTMGSIQPSLDDNVIFHGRKLSYPQDNMLLE